MITEVYENKFEWLYSNFIDVRSDYILRSYLYFKNFIYPILNKYINISIAPEKLGLYAFNDLSFMVTSCFNLIVDKINALIRATTSNGHNINTIINNNNYYYPSNLDTLPQLNICPNTLENFRIDTDEITINMILSSLDNYSLIKKLRLEILKYTFNLLCQRLLIMRHNAIDMNKVKNIKLYWQCDSDVVFPLYSDKNYLTRASIKEYNTIKDFVDGFFPFCNQAPQLNLLFDYIVCFDIFYDDYCIREVSDTYLHMLKDSKKDIINALKNNPEVEFNNVITEIDFYNENVNPENSIYKVYEWKDNRDEVVFE